MKKPYLDLRKELYGAEIDQRQIGKIIGRSKSYVNVRMTGKADWTIGEAYALLQALGRQPEEIYQFFPPNGGVKSRMST